MLAIRFILQALGGIVCLIPIYLLLGGMPEYSFPFVLLVGLFAPLLNAFWIAACIAFLVVGERMKMPGVAWSPLVLCILWFCLSVLHRAYLTQDQTTGMQPGPPAMDLKHKTLSLLGPGDCCWFYKALAEGKVARIVLAGENVLDYKPERERAITHTRGDVCHQPERKIDESGKYKLRAAGRLDECFIETETVGIPDGLIIRTRGFHNAGYRTDFIVRESGHDTITGEWVSKGPKTLSYFPMIGLSLSASTGIWTPALGGPLQTLEFGQQIKSQRGAAIALFGDDVVGEIPPLLDLHGPKILSEALSLSETGKFQDRDAALRLANLALQNGNVTDVTYDVMAASACDNSFGKVTAYENFVRSLNEENSAILLRKIFNRASDLRYSTERGSCKGLLPSVGAQRPAFEAVAKALFARKGLGIWQYDVVIDFLRCPIGASKRACNPNLRDEIAEIVFSDQDPKTFTGRAIAFANLASDLSDQDIERIVPFINAIPEDYLVRFITALRIDYILRSHAKLNDSITINKLRDAVRYRLSYVRDERISGYLKEFR